MKSSLHLRLMLVLTPTLIITTVLLGFLLRQQTVSQFVVYLSSQEQLERLEPHDRFLLRFYADRIAGVMAVSESAGITRIVDVMSGSVGRQIIVARNDDAFYASGRLREMEMDLRVNETGVLFAAIRDDSGRIQADLELTPVVTQEITPFTVDDARPADIARIYSVPTLTRVPQESEQEFVLRTTTTIGLLTAGATFVMILLLGAVLAGTLRPVRKLTEAANALRRGHEPEPVAVGGPREINDLAGAFNEMSRAIRKTSESRRRLLADISHELRGPLSNLRSQIEAVQDGLLVSDEATVGSLHEDVMLLTRLVEDLHELALVDTQSLRLDLQLTSAATIVESAVKPLRPAMLAQRVELETDTPLDLPAVRVDPQRISQVIRNILQNSLRYAGDRSVTITASAGSGAVRITISDTGPGVPAEDLERIFERLYRTDPSRARTSGGSGLGLAIARAIVLSHGGRITACANEPHGLSVTIELPASDA